MAPISTCHNPSMMDSFTTLSFKFLWPSGAYALVQPFEKLLYSFQRARGAKLEIAAPFKPWKFLANLESDDVPISTKTGFPSVKECSPLTIPLNDGYFYHPKFFNSFVEWSVSTSLAIARWMTTVELKVSNY